MSNKIQWVIGLVAVTSLVVSVAAYMKANGGSLRIANVQPLTSSASGASLQQSACEVTGGVWIAMPKSSGGSFCLSGSDIKKLQQKSSSAY